MISLGLPVLYINYPAWLKPEIISGLPVRWYGLMYVVAFTIGFYSIRKISSNDKRAVLSKTALEDLFVYGVVGLLLGARFFYVFVYNFSDYYPHNLAAIILPFAKTPQGIKFVGIQGLSFHGGVIGASIGFFSYCRRKKLALLTIYDYICQAAPFAYTFGRLGNFANGELYGKVSAGPLAMLFPQADFVYTAYSWVKEIAHKTGINLENLRWVNLPRHPSQLYEAFFEGIILGLFLWFVIAKRKKFDGFITAWFLIGYGFVRFFIEYLREPDGQLGYVLAFGPGADTPQVFVSLANFSMGQVLCAIMMLSGVGVYFIGKHQAKQRHKAG